MISCLHRGFAIGNELNRIIQRVVQIQTDIKETTEAVTMYDMM